MDYLGDPSVLGHRSPIKREAGGSGSESKDIRMEAEVREERCYTAGFEYGGRDHEPRNAGSFWKIEKTGNRSSPEASKRNTAMLTP